MIVIDSKNGNEIWNSQFARILKQNLFWWTWGVFHADDSALMSFPTFYFIFLTKSLWNSDTKAKKNFEKKFI